MAQEICRLCLFNTELKPIFHDDYQHEEMITKLESTTGLKIYPNDGLPQQICEKCSDSVNKFIQFRNKAHKSEIELFKLGFRRTVFVMNEQANTTANTDDCFDSFPSDSYNFKTFKIEVELDRITQYDDENPTPNEISVEAESRNGDPQKKNRKEMRQLYLSYVDGEFVGDGPIKCKICKKSLKTWKTFIHHIKKHLGSELEMECDKTTQAEDEIVEAKEPVEASENNQIKKKSREEMRQLYMSYVDGELVPDGPVKCKICKKIFKKWNSFLNHARKHLGFKFVCEFCGKSFISSNQLKRHCRSFHGMARDLKCKYCTYLALDKPQLRVHERRVHTGERPFVCDLCAAAYFSRKCLLQHLESHRTTTSVQCDKCPMSFKSRRHLSKHVYGTHSDKRRERRRKQRQANNDVDT